jgi:methionine transaminase
MLYSKLSNLDFELVSTFSRLANVPGKIDLAGSYGYDQTPQVLLEELKRAQEDSQNLSAQSYGHPILRESIAAKLANNYGHKYNPTDEITITTSTPQTVFTIMAAFLEEGDEVILFEPADEHYLPNILLAGARPVYIALKEPDFHIDWEEVTRMITSNTRLIIINTPHNPTGMVFTELDMLRLQKVINGTRILVLSDESFEHLVYDSNGHQSVALYPKLAEKSILINALAAGCNTSWPVAYCAAPQSLMLPIRKVLQVIDGAQYIPFQSALANLIPQKEFFHSINKHFREKRDLFQDLMEQNTRFRPIPSQGTWYQLYSYSAISEEKDKVFAQWLFEQAGVAVAPYSAFFHEKQKVKLLRFNFARPTYILEEAVEKLSRI